MVNYLVVLFKNKSRKKIIKKFVTLTKAKNFYNSLLESSSKVIFPILVEGRKNYKFELGLVEMSSKQLIPIYMTDEYGRNVKVRLKDEDMTLVNVSPFNLEELIHDNQTKKKITSPDIIKKYFTKKTLKMLYSLNNKAILQEDDDFKIFTLKNESEALRFVDCMSKHFFLIKRDDCLFINDTSVAQKKYLYKILESKGFSKSQLYRKFT